jgi:hypothetical protein
LGLQLGLFGGDILFKGVGCGSAAFHDTTCCLRVLTVGLAKSDRNMPTPRIQFQSDITNSAKAPKSLVPLQIP